ncbi:MAG TPA: SpoIID/LytB domain-containing protein, partial [Nitrospira sp.]
MTRRVLWRSLGLILGTVLGTSSISAVEAAQSLRVLLAGDVSQLDVQAEHSVWISDSTRQGWAVRSTVHIVPSAKGFAVNRIRIGRDHLTLRGEHGLILTLVRPGGTSNTASGTTSGGPPKLSSDQRLTVPVSGLVHVIRRGEGFLVINQVDLEEYVKGVVPAEVNSSWHPEMLKAQAVAARTYALYQQMLSATRDYDVAASVQDQVYRGKQGIDAAVLRAVEETRGLVLTYQDAPIYAAFSSTAAGLTEDAMNVWSKDYPYLKGVECPFDLGSPYYQWTASFKRELLEHNLRQQGFAIGTISAMTPLSLSRGGRVATLRLVHSEGELVLRGEDLRKAVGYMVVPSTQFTIDTVG